MRAALFLGAYILLVQGRIYINDLLLPSVFQVHDLASRFDAGPTTDRSFHATTRRGSPPGTPEHYATHPRTSALFSLCPSSKPDAINRSSAAHRPIMKYVPLPPLARLSDPYHTPLQLPIYSQRDYNQSRTSPEPRTGAQLAYWTSASLPISLLIGASHDRLLSRRLCSHSPAPPF